jgi:hypothetical protein
MMTDFLAGLQGHGLISSAAELPRDQPLKTEIQSDGDAVPQISFVVKYL